MLPKSDGRSNVTNEKLRARAVNLVRELTQAEKELILQAWWMQIGTLKSLY